MAAVADAYAGWVDAVHRTRAEIRAEAIAEGAFILYAGLSTQQ